MLHSGCLYYGLRSACIDVTGLAHLDPLRPQSIYVTGLHIHLFVEFAEVEYHRRMDILSPMGMMVMLQQVRRLKQTKQEL